MHPSQPRRRVIRSGSSSEPPLVVIIVTSHPKRRGRHEKVWPIAAHRAIGPRAIGSTAAGVERDDDVTWRSHFEHGSQVRESDALSRVGVRGRGEGGGGRRA